MKQEDKIAAAVRAIRPNAKATPRACLWEIKDGNEVISVTCFGRRTAWDKALSNLRKRST